jgi:hypothetical protein
MYGGVQIPKLCWDGLPMTGTHITQVNYDRQEVVKYALDAIQTRFHAI